MQVSVMQNGDVAQNPNGFANNLLVIWFNDRGCTFNTGLEINLTLDFERAKQLLRENGERRAAAMMSRDQRRYRRSRFQLN